MALSLPSLFVLALTPSLTSPVFFPIVIDLRMKSICQQLLLSSKPPHTPTPQQPFRQELISPCLHDKVHWLEKFVVVCSVLFLLFPFPCYFLFADEIRRGSLPRLKQTQCYWGLSLFRWPSLTASVYRSLRIAICTPPPPFSRDIDQLSVAKICGASFILL